MNLKEIRDLALEGASEASQGHIATATNKFALAIAGASQLAMDMGFKAEAGDAECKAEIVAAFEKGLEAASTVKASEPAAVGKWGDGVFLTKLLELALKFLPLVL